MEVFEDRGMPQLDATTVIALLSCCLGLLILAVLMLCRISSRMSRIESLLVKDVGRSEALDETPSVAETSPGGAFETFLNEDPARRSMTKGEQFAAYRQWRHEKGMNWSNS